MKTPRLWKDHYREEREALGDAGLAALVERAVEVALPEHGALIFPHTHLRASGHLTAGVARAVVRSERETVLALGVLHGGPAAPRGVHAAAGAAADEFSLDNFEALLEVAARVEGRPTPRLVGRFPYLVGERPDDLPGFEELVRLRAEGAALVATADPIHHGAGYGTPPSEWRRREEALAFARSTIEEGLALLARRDFAGFLAQARVAKSDFRDPGPVLAALLSEGDELDASVLEVDLADYSATLGAAAPTWVAGALSLVSARAPAGAR